MEKLLDTVSKLEDILKDTDLFITAEIKVDNDVLMAICKQENLWQIPSTSKKRAYTVWNLERLILIINEK